MTTVLSEAMRAGDNLEVYFVDLMTTAMKRNLKILDFLSTCQKLYVDVRFRMIVY